MNGLVLWKELDASSEKTLEETNHYGTNSKPDCAFAAVLNCTAPRNQQTKINTCHQNVHV